MGDVRRLIAFDLDGTLIDSRRDLADSANALLQEHRAGPLSEDAVGQMVGEGARVLVARALTAAGLGHVDVSAALARFLDIYDTCLLGHTLPYEGIVDAVQYARRFGRVMVLTNKPTRPSETILAGLGLRGLFDEVVGGDGPWPRKPDPAALTAAMARCGADPTTTLVVGDSAIDHETAERASAWCCLAAYGFSYHTMRQRPVGEKTWTVEAPAEIRSVIDRFVAGR